MGFWVRPAPPPTAAVRIWTKSPTFPKPALGLIKEGRIVCVLFRHQKNCRRKEESIFHQADTRNIHFPSPPRSSHSSHPVGLIKSNDRPAEFVTHSHKVEKEVHLKVTPVSLEVCTLNSEHHLPSYVSQLSNSQYRDPCYILYINLQDADVLDG